MTQKINELISVTSIFDHQALLFFPQSVVWHNHTYEINKIGLHHEYQKGSILYHVFSVTTDSLFLRLLFNTKNLNWRLEEISDGF